MQNKQSGQLLFNFSSSSNAEIKQLLFDLLHSDTESSVIEILKQYDYWDHPSLWRFYGDKEGNFSTIGNQSNSPEAALVEKIVNSIDAVLMNQCWLTGMSPSAPSAPQSIIHAVSKYFGNGTERMGNIINWSTQTRNEISRRITVAATGSRSKRPCFTITDDGEGQNPYSISDTLLSLDRRNKVSRGLVNRCVNVRQRQVPLPV